EQGKAVAEQRVGVPSEVRSDAEAANVAADLELKMVVQIEAGARTEEGGHPRRALGRRFREPPRGDLLVQIGMAPADQAIDQPIAGLAVNADSALKRPIESAEFDVLQIGRQVGLDRLNRLVELELHVDRFGEHAEVILARLEVRRQAKQRVRL